MTQRGTPTTVFVHGFLDDAAVWRHVVEARARPTPVALVDLAGMGGRPDAPGPFTLARWADEVVRTIDDVTGPVVLVGQSLGAQVAELAAVQRPDRIVGMALLTPVPLAGTRMPADALALFEALGGDGPAQCSLRRRLSSAFPDDELERLGAAGGRTTAEAVADAVHAWNDGDPAGSAPSAITVPVLVVRGGDDPFITAEAVDAGVVPRFPDVTTATVRGAGHWPHVERPALVATLVDDLVARVSDDASLTHAHQMRRTAHEFPPDVDEFEAVGLGKEPSEVVTPPRVAGAPIHFECRLERIIPVGELDDHVVWGVVERVHVRDDLYLDRGRVDTAALSPVGRLAAEYTLVENVFTTPLDDGLVDSRGGRMRRLDEQDPEFSPIDTDAWHPSGST